MGAPRAINSFLFTTTDDQAIKYLHTLSLLPWFLNESNTCPPGSFNLFLPGSGLGETRTKATHPATSYHLERLEAEDLARHLFTPSPWLGVKLLDQ